MRPLSKIETGRGCLFKLTDVTMETSQTVADILSIDVKLPPRPIRIHEKNIQSATFHTSLINIQTYKISRIVYPLISDTPVDAESSGLSTDDIKSGGRTFSPTQKSGKPSKTCGQGHFDPSAVSPFVCPEI
jgi:hypothetical protein